MRFIPACLVASLLFSLVPDPSIAAVTSPEPRIASRERQQGFRNTRILAKPRRDRRAEAETGEAQIGVELRQKFPRFGDLRILEVNSSEISAVIAQLQATGNYEYVEPDFLRTAESFPNDPRFGSGDQWYLHNTGEAGGLAGADIDAATAWSIRTDAPDVIVAVIDTGIRHTHEDLVANLWTNPNEIPGNGIDDDANGYVDDVHGINSLAAIGSAQSGDVSDDAGHGTRIAGLIAAVGNNGKGLAGVAWKAKIMALKFDDAEGSASVSNQIECLEYAIANGARIINLSYGSYNFSQAEFDALGRAREMGAIIVTSSGNDGIANDFLQHYPSNYLLDNIVAVAATDRNDALADFSSFSSGLVELAAPGVGITSTARSADNAYDTENGTSFAAPLVSGALALLQAQYPQADYRASINRLLSGVDRLPALSGKIAAAGRMNLARALAAQSAQPFNDDFEHRAPLDGLSVATRTHLRHATVQPDEPSHAGSSTTGTLWWEWTAPFSGDVAVETTGSAIDTVLAVYIGTGLASLVPIASNDDTFDGTTSRLSFAAQLGQTYVIAAGAKNGIEGAIVLSVGFAPQNDDFAEAESLQGPSLRVSGFNTGTSAEPNERRAVTSARARSVWYKWTAPSSSYFSVSLFAYGFDGVLAVYTGADLATLQAIGTGSTRWDNESVSFSATAGTTYYFQVDTVSSTGAFDLTVVDGLGISAYYAVDATPAVSDKTTVIFAPDSFGVITTMRIEPFSLNFHELSGTLDVQTPALAADGSLFLGDDFGYFYSLTPTGTRRWRKDMGLTGISSSPAIAADGTIYLHTDDGQLHSFHFDGAAKWTVPVPGESYSSPAIGADGTIYIGSSDESLYALSPLDGAMKWRFEADGEIYSSPALDTEDNVYFATLNGKVYSLSRDGQPRWIFTAGGAVSSSPAIGADGTIYFGCYDAFLYAVSSAGKLKWKYETGYEIRASSPSITADGTIYIGSYDGYVHAVTPGGVRRRLYATGAYIRSSPLIYEQSLLIGSGDARLYIMDAGSDLAAAPWPTHRQNNRRTGSRLISTVPKVVSATPARAVAADSATSLAVNATGADDMNFQWYHNGAAVSGANYSTLSLPSVASAQTGIYAVQISNPLGSTLSEPLIVGLRSTSKVIGAGSEVGANILHSNKNIFDQVLLEGASATVTADPGQVLRMSYLDLQDDIVQIEFSGAGTLSVSLDAATGPIAPVNYNQTVNYMRGHASIVITDADESTHLTVFSVGRATAVNPALFRESATYDGFADIACVAIASRTGTFGGMRSGNTRFSATKGITGLYAPGVKFRDNVFLHDIDASGTAIPYFLIRGANETRITGGDLLQSNSRPVRVGGLSRVQFTAGTDSHGNLLPVRSNLGRLEENGTDVTSMLVETP